MFKNIILALIDNPVIGEYNKYDNYYDSTLRQLTESTWRQGALFVHSIANEYIKTGCIYIFGYKLEDSFKDDALRVSTDCNFMYLDKEGVIEAVRFNCLDEFYKRGLHV